MCFWESGEGLEGWTQECFLLTATSRLQDKFVKILEQLLKFCADSAGEWVACVFLPLFQGVLRLAEFFDYFSPFSLK